MRQQHQRGGQQSLRRFRGRGSRAVTVRSFEPSAPVKKKPSAPVAPLIRLGDEYIKHNKNVMLIADHGVGKSTALQELAEKHGLKVKYYSCATLDPYTDLVGVPVPRGPEGNEYLEMIRPRDIEDADIVFFDELNRADRRVQDAVLEIVQAHSINGVPLPKLRACWAAINPPNGDEQAGEQVYEVEELDPALMDRWDAYVHLSPQVSVPYMSQYIEVSTAEALKAWWDGHKRSKRGADSYISPRRLLKIGLAWDQIGSQQAVVECLPPGGTYDHGKLIGLLRRAQAGAALTTNIQDNNVAMDAPEIEMDYKANSLIARQEQIIDFLQRNPKSLMTQQKIVQSLKGMSAKRLQSEMLPMLDALPPSQAESVVEKFSGRERDRLKDALYSYQEHQLMMQEAKKSGKKLTGPVAMYTRETIRANKTAVIKHLRTNQQQAAVDAPVILAALNNVAPTEMIDEYVEILNQLPPEETIKWFSKQTSARKSQLRRKFLQTYCGHTGPNPTSHLVNGRWLYKVKKRDAQKYRGILEMLASGPTNGMPSPKDMGV